MKETLINTQKKLDALKEIKVDEKVTIEGELILGEDISVFGTLSTKGRLKFNYGCRIVAWGNSSVEAWGNSSVVARGNSSVEAWGNSSVVARGNSSVVARGNSSVVAWENSSVEARENSSVEARENSSVEAWGNSSVVAWGNSSVEAWGNSSVVARGNSVVRIRCAIKNVVLYGFSVCFKPFDLKFKIEKKSKTTIIQNIEPLDYFKRNGIEKTKKIILYKRVSHDYKTQENTPNETLWLLGTIVVHPSWNPKEKECGEGKFHAVSRPYFADEFRSTKNDKYVAIEIECKDLYEWKDDPQYPHKIGFRRGRVLYDVDKFGKALK